MSDTNTNEDTLLITPDLSEVADRIAPGVYNMRITGSKIGKWEGRDGKPSTTWVAWTLATFGEAEEKNNGRHYTHTTPIHGKGAFRLTEFYKAAMNEDLKGQFDRTMLHGKEVIATISTQKNNPEYTEIKSVKAYNH